MVAMEMAAVLRRCGGSAATEVQWRVAPRYEIRGSRTPSCVCGGTRVHEHEHEHRRAVKRHPDRKLLQIPIIKANR